MHTFDVNFMNANSIRKISAKYLHLLMGDNTFRNYFQFFILFSSSIMITLSNITLRNSYDSRFLR